MPLKVIPRAKSPNPPCFLPAMTEHPPPPAPLPTAPFSPKVLSQGFWRMTTPCTWLTTLTPRSKTGVQAPKTPKPKHCTGNLRPWNQTNLSSETWDPGIKQISPQVMYAQYSVTVTKSWLIYTHQLFQSNILSQQWKPYYQPKEYREEQSPLQPSEGTNPTNIYQNLIFCLLNYNNKHLLFEVTPPWKLKNWISINFERLLS